MHGKKKKKVKERPMFSFQHKSQQYNSTVKNTESQFKSEFNSFAKCIWTNKQHPAAVMNDLRALNLYYSKDTHKSGFF